MKAVEEYTLEEINQIEDLELRKNFQIIYQAKRIELGSTPFSKRVIERYPESSIRTLETMLNSEYLESTSYHHFPNKPVCFYPTIRESVSEFMTTCAFSGGKIKKGSLYYSYRPLLDVVDSGRVYVLKKTIKLETSYVSDLPTTMQEFDIFTEKIESYWNYGNDPIDYEQLNYYLGGSVDLLELRKGRKRR